MPDLTLTPAGWLALLTRKLDEQAAAVKQPMDYYNGLQKLAFATAKFREAFSRYFPPMANNWMKLVVDAPVSRLRVQGLRFDTDPSLASWDQEADRDAWAIWQANNLDAGADMAHTEAIKLGIVNLLVSPPVDGGEPLITVEHPSQTFVLCSYANRRHRLAAIKRWVDDDGYGYATIYLPTLLHKFRSIEPVKNTAGGISHVQWTRRLDDPAENNPIGVVPMVPLENNPDLLYGGRSDLEVAIPIQDAINKLCLDMQVSSEFHAYPQRYATGWETSEDAAGNELTGKQVELAASQTRMLRATSPDTTFGQLEPGNVDNYIKPIDLYVDHLAAVTQTPAYYLKGKMANLSAEALQAADQGLVDRVNRKILNFSDGWEETLRVAFLAKGDQRRGRSVTAECLWADPESKSLAQLTDAAVKMRTSLSVPLEMCWELMGWSPQKIRQAKAMMNLPDQPPGVPMNPGGPRQPFSPDATLPSGLVLPAASS